jgi:hypothetical protein
MKPKVGSGKKGGRKRASIAAPDLEENLRQVVRDHTAGDPIREEVVWTYLSSTEIAARLDRWGTPVCPDTVRSLLKKFGFRVRAVTAQGKSCVACHEQVGHDESLGFISIEFENPPWR